MKKSGLILLVLVFLFSHLHVYALEKTNFMNMKQKFFSFSKELKELLIKSSDVVYLNGLWNACILSISQIDAYLVMLGILSSIKEKKIPSSALEYLKAWLERMQGTAAGNLKALETPPENLEPKTRQYIEKMKILLNDFNSLINKELTAF